MKNTLNYFYGLDVSNIHQKDKVYYFNYLDYQYIFMPCDIDNMYECSMKLYQYGVHQIILNRSGTILTSVNNTNYILMKMFTDKRTVNINDIIRFNNLSYYNKKMQIPNWYILWTEKVDYAEYQMNQMGKKYKLIRDSFSYYIGLSENAISLIKTININDNYYCLNHNRIYHDSNMQDLYNPINFIIDIKYRDVCEYFKDCFFNNIDNNIITYMEYNVLNYNDGCIFLSRMLFPTYYFDLYEKIINDEIDDSSINIILNKVNEYEQLLKTIYSYLRIKFSIPILEWLD